MAKAKKKIKLPAGYSDEAAFLYEMREIFNENWEADRLNREAAVEDAKFVAGEQWDERMKRRRIRDRKPIITVNRLPAYIGQIIGNRRLNQTSIKFLPDVGGTKEIAEVREGLTRNIEKESRAERAYDNALQNAAIGGIGNFGVSLEYADDDVFDQDIRINAITNPLAVVWDRHMTDPTGADAMNVFEVDTMSRKVFNKQFPDAGVGDITLDSVFMQDMVQNGWVTLDDVRIVRYWRIVKKDRDLALMLNGDILDVTDKEIEEYLGDVQLDDDGEPYVRTKKRTYAEMYVCTGVSILEGPYTLPIKRVPIFRVPGYEIDVSERRERFGIVRFAKDPQRMHNYWRSVIVEKLMLTPKAPWVASKEAVAGYEKQWRNAHLSNDTLLIYNGEAALPPQRTPPAQIESALITESQMTSQDMRDVTNMHEASMGQQSNEVSGKAIRARQAVGELGTVVYTDNLNAAIEECGRVINDLIPVVYDTRRQIKTLGPDMKEKIVLINARQDAEDLDEDDLIEDEMDEEKSIDITSGKYSVTCITGPSYATKRMESADSMLNMTNAMPETMAVSADLIVENQDWPGAEKIAKRLRRAIDPKLLGPDDMDDEEKAQMAQAQEGAKKQEAMAEQMHGLAMDEMKAKIREANARAQQAEAQAFKTYEDVDVDAMKLWQANRKLDIEEFKEGGAAVSRELDARLAAKERLDGPKTPEERTQ